jgi:hypothetical protein
MAFGTIGEELDQGRAGVGAGAVSCPALGRIDRQCIVAVDPQASDTIADGARRERRTFGPGYPGEPRLPEMVKKFTEAAEYRIGSWRPFSLSARFE